VVDNDRWCVGGEGGAGGRVCGAAALNNSSISTTAINAYLWQNSTFGRSTGMTLLVALSQAVLNTSQFMIVQVGPIKVCRS
jgi:hypothetical protein